jgi:diaminopropionate ammonia-lyase
VIFVGAGVSEGRAAAIAAYGAEVRRLPGSYDDAVRHAAKVAAERGWTVVSDTSYEGYTDIPRDVMHGYGLMADEAMAQLAMDQGARPTHVLVHAGVGAWAAAMCARFWQEWGAARPRFVVVEPDRADALYRSAVAGRMVEVLGPHDTVMAGLACGEVSPLAWEILATGADDFVVIPDARAVEGMRALATPAGGDPPVVAGETGAASLGALLAASADPPLKAALGLDATARVLLFGSEGATDPEIYRTLVGRSAEQVTAGLM